MEAEQEEKKNYDDTLPANVKERLEEVDCDADDTNIVLLHGMERALVGTMLNGKGILVAVYEENLCIECLADDFRKDNPDRDDAENWTDAEEWFSYNTLRAIPYMGEGAPVVIRGFHRDEEKWREFKDA